MQRVLSVYDWQCLPDGEAAVIPSDVEHLRPVRLRVNAPSPLALYVKTEDCKDAIFLAYVQGLDEIQFNVTGPYKLFAIGGELWFDTLDGARADVEPVDATSFTSIVERRARNPELEIMERKMQQNMERRMAALLGVVGERLEENERELLAARTALAAASAAAREQDAGSVPPDTQSEQATGGTGGQSGGE